MFPTESLADPNLRSPAYYVARTEATCRHCGSSTPLLALALPRAHETLEDAPAADESGLGESAMDAWQHADVDAFLFYVQQLPHRVQQRLQQIVPGFRQAQSVATQSICWVNHCEHCGALLDDYELHCEPEGAFMPCSEAEAQRIHLLRILEPIEVLAAGYAPDPAFFSLIPAG